MPAAAPCRACSTRRHGGCRGGSEQNGGVSLVALDCVACAVKLAEREQPLWIARRGRSAQMSRGCHAVAGNVSRNQAEGEMSCHIAARGHVPEMDARALVTLGRGALQPLDGLCPVKR